MLTHRMLLAGVALALSLPYAATAQINLYEEDFTGTGVDEPMTQVGWVGHITRSDMVVAGALVPSLGAGGSWENANILAGGGYLLYVTSSYPQLLAWTEEASFNLNNYDSLTFSFESRNNNAVATMQPMVRVDGSWYITADSATHLAASNTWQDNSFHVTSDASDWLVLNFDGTSTTDATGMATVGGTPGSSLSGTVDAVGIYFNNWNGTTTLGSGNDRIDNFSITAVPEPSTYALLGGLFALGFAQLRRRKGKAA